MHQTLLPALLIIPLLGALGIMLAPARQARWVALAASTLAFIVAVIALFLFDDWHTGGFGLKAPINWMSRYGILTELSVDSVALLLVGLTALLVPLCVWGSFTAINDRLKEYYGWMMVLEAAMLGVFMAHDLVFFYVCFELTLLPMFFLIAIYGGANRGWASIKFFLFTFTGSIITLAGLIYIAWQQTVATGTPWTFDIYVLTDFAVESLSATQQSWVLLALLCGFAVKIPLFPVHTWLPLAHTEAPTAGSVILAAVLLKLGTYGLYRFVLPMVPEAVVQYAPAIAVLSIIGILYAALICWVQSDIKKLVAYSSVSHLGFCVLGLVALNPLGAQGSVLYMLNHGLSTGALFFLVGMIYERYHTRDMSRMSGLARRMPVWAFFMVFFVLSSVGLPGLNGFVSEFLCLIGAFTSTTDAAEYPGLLGPWYAAVAGIGMIFAAMYLLIMVGKVVFGPLKEPAVDEDEHHGPSLPADLTFREIAVLVPLAVLCLYIGLRPLSITDRIAGSIDQALAEYPTKVQEHLYAEREPDAAAEQLSGLAGPSMPPDDLMLVNPAAERASAAAPHADPPRSAVGTSAPDAHSSLAATRTEELADG